MNYAPALSISSSPYQPQPGTLEPDSLLGDIVSEIYVKLQTYRERVFAPNQFPLPEKVQTVPDLESSRRPLTNQQLIVERESDLILNFTQFNLPVFWLPRDREIQVNELNKSQPVHEASSSCLPTPQPGFGEFEQILEGFECTSTLELRGADFNNTLVRDFYIHDVVGDGIFLKDVSNVKIEQGRIENITSPNQFTDAGSGIKFSGTGSTSHVTLNNITIKNTDINGIVAFQNEGEGVNHSFLRILNNYIDGTGNKNNYYAANGKYHGIYMQAQDFLIEENIVLNSRGHGISVRSSGEISGNVVGFTGRSGIAYFNDHQRGASNELIIQDNLVAGNADGSASVAPLQSAIELVDNGGNEENLVENFFILSNTAISNINPNSNVYALKIGTGYPEDGSYLEVSFNTLVNTETNSIVAEDSAIDEFNSNTEIGVDDGVNFPFGDNDDDILIGTLGSDILDADGGNDYLDSRAGNDILFGGEGADQFVLRPGEGEDLIFDYQDSIDSFFLEGLTFEELTITQGTGQTRLSLTTTNEILASLIGVDASLVGLEDFTNLA